MVSPDGPSVFATSRTQTLAASRRLSFDKRCASGAYAGASRAQEQTDFPLRDDSYESHLPEDLQSLAADLRANRSTADGHVLERVQKRVHDQPRRRRGRRLLTARAAGTAIIALAAVL